MGRRHFCNFLGKTKRRRHTSRGICISTWSISETDLLRFVGPISVSGWDWWRSVCWLCSWTSASSSGTPLAPSSSPFLSPAPWSRIEEPGGPDEGKECKVFFGERENLKSCFNLFCNKRSLKVIIYGRCQSCKGIILFVQTLCQNRKYFLSSNFVQEILIFLKLCARGRKCWPATAFAASNTALVAMSPFTLPLTIPVYKESCLCKSWDKKYC